MAPRRPRHAEMVKELEAAPAEVGFLGHTSFGFSMVQYWHGFDHLERYARDRDALHWPAWVAFSRRMKETRGDVGIWHETYKIRAGEYEAIHSGMPPFGLGNASPRATLKDSDGARQRLEGGYAPALIERAGGRFVGRCGNLACYLRKRTWIKIELQRIRQHY
jgi:Domain of unknown function (DUF4188)